MPTFPTPFIGGAQRPQLDRSAKRQLEPPFYIERDATETEVQPAEAAAAEPETPVGGEPVADEEFEFFEGLEPEPEASEYEGPVPVQQAAPAEEPVGIEEMASAAEPQPVAAPLEEPGPGEAEPADESIELPDFLLGPDSTAAAEAPGEAVGPEPPTPEALSRVAEELLDTPDGDRIRQLVAELGSSAAEVAIPRAFAAGYLAAKSREES